MKLMEIARSSRLVLRNVEVSDRTEIVAMHESGTSVERWSPPLRPGTTFDQMFDTWLGDNPTHHVALVTERLDGSDGPRLANVIRLTDIVRGVFQGAHIGWRTHPALLGRGYCVDAVLLTLRHAFSETGLGLHRVQAAILPDNLASRRVAEKCGFRLEGVAQRYLLIREQWRDHLIFAITSKEFSTTPTDYHSNRW
jgi:ribosomal-protein-alanine N-acetyltransferase